MPQKDSFTTQEIVEKLRIGENVEGITTYLYRRFEGKSIRLVQRLGGTYEDAEDVLHDSLLALLHHIQEDKFDAVGVASLDTYFYSIIENRWFNLQRSQHRRAAREQQYSQEKGIVDDGNTLTDKETSAYSLIKKLEDLCQKILVAYYVEEKSLDDIAALFGLSEVNVRVRKHRCMKKLSSLVNDL